MLALSGDLVDSDLEQLVETIGVQLLVADPLDDSPDRPPVDRNSRLMVPLSVRLTSHATKHSKSRVNSDPGPGERDALGERSVARTVNLSARAANLKTPGAQIQMAPDRIHRPRVFACAARVLAMRADQPPATKRDVDHDIVGREESAGNFRPSRGARIR